MKTILGLDLGTNSISWAYTEMDFSNKEENHFGSSINGTNKFFLFVKG
jgi:CRISPR/Cas system Type II protein with McrA/HNH and RuvC-like nuclease domain